jgi:hypothetical protein
MGPTDSNPDLTDHQSAQALANKSQITWCAKLETALPNPPKLTAGEVVVHTTRELVGT